MVALPFSAACVSYPQSWSSLWVNPLSFCGWGLHQGSSEPCREWQVGRVGSLARVAPPLGSCALAVAFESGPCSCAPGGDAGWLMGAWLFPGLLAAAGLRWPLLGCLAIDFILKVNYTFMLKTLCTPTSEHLQNICLEVTVRACC